MTVQELIDTLQQFNPQAKVEGTWGGQVRPIEVYRVADGRVFIDADNGDYRIHFQKLKCVVCGGWAKGDPNGKPVCFEHWNTNDFTE